ncbi:BON domain-containing protein [Telmatocola sphagniphila]|jgi:osmotically-inducible protein OsmY|uniref:BON domain-containing protein n=1 Tax=Telmatocola sphagniphila TaxID=1123043 RepID=A0A8E6EZV1_9BACT|nr:BON domain-containing protein [Telmatocola sphagniphila]QVL34118.1 BON domain-containing protein [Telmatocola sphagniphila]
MDLDGELEKTIRREIMWEPNARDSQINISVEEGHVLLGGWVNSYAEKWAVEKIASRVAGIRGFATTLALRGSGYPL